jgi:hypothetical protein
MFTHLSFVALATKALSAGAEIPLDRMQRFREAADA